MESQDIFEDSAVAGSAHRIEVFKGTQTLKLKVSDITVERLARIFKLVPSSIYLEEDLTGHDEFAVAGKFGDLGFGRYEVCGDLASEAEQVPRNVEGFAPQPSPRPWSIGRSWTSQPSTSLQVSATPRNATLMAKQTYEKFLKRSIPFVSLCLDQANRNIVIDSIVSNVYIKIADSSVSGQSILSEVAPKVGCEAADLMILDAKFIEVSDDKDLEYWKVPSRKLYIAKKSEYEDIMKVKSRKRLSLKRKKRPEEQVLSVDEESTSAAVIHRLETKVDKVEGDIALLIDSNEELRQFKLAKANIMNELECKICKALPRGPKVLTLCCRQILGCQQCMARCLREQPVCPLCRADNPDSVNVNGLDQVYSFLESLNS